jgi:MFS family permease
MTSTIRQVFSERNIATLSISTFFFIASHYIWNTWSSLYLLALGATPEIVGLFALVREAPRWIFQFPGGILADRFGRKRLIVFCTAAQIIAPLSFLFAITWQHLLPGQLFDSIIWSLYQPAREALITESLPRDRRGSAYGAFRMAISLPRMFLPVLIGMIMDRIGVIESVRIGFVLIIIVHVLITLMRAVLLRETLSKRVDITQSIEQHEKKSFLQVFRGGFNLPKTILIMLVVTTLSGFVFRMVQPFMVIYIVEIAKLTKTQWGLIDTILGIFNAFLVFPSGVLADRFGRRNIIFLARILNPFDKAILLLFRDFSQILLLYSIAGVGTALGGERIGMMGTMGGPAWMALIADVVPSRNRGKIIGLLSMVSGLVGLPSSLIGGYIWSNLGPDILLLTTFLGGLIPPIIFFLFVKEPKTRET